MNYLELIICTIIGAILTASVICSANNVVEKVQSLPSSSIQIEEFLDTDFSSFEFDVNSLLT